jgi:carboxymethylproline synthase
MLTEKRDNLLVVTFNHGSKSNPMGRESGLALIDICEQAEQDESVDALVLTGGVGRFFGAGGDFAEVSEMQGGVEVDAWIDWIIALYTGILKVSKPTVAAIDGYAVGIGFQIALCADWRVGTESSILLMPELEKGIGCTFGGMMLERALGRLRMTHIVYGCERILAREALALGLLDETQPASRLLERAAAVARRFARYPATAMRGTKRAINAPFIAALEGIAESSKRVHRSAFRAGGARTHFETILERGQRGAHAHAG